MLDTLDQVVHGQPYLVLIEAPGWVHHHTGGNVYERALQPARVETYSVL